MLAAAAAPVVPLVVAAAGLLSGWLFATLLRRQDHKTFVFARAPQLPVRALAAHDDAWLRGVVNAIAPLRCPWFDVPCVAYSYTIEREVKTTRKDKDGKEITERSWKTERHDTEAVPFELDDGARVVVDLPNATNEAMTSLGTDYETSTRRHSARVLQPGATVSALGVLRDDRTFGPLAEVPLVVTSATRAERVRAAARSEGWLFAMALLFPFLGGSVAAGLWLGGDGPAWAIGVAVGGAAMAPLWWLLTWNRFVRLRQQVQAALRQIDVDTKLRFDLVPNLVATLRAAAGHERELLTRVAELRAAGGAEAAVHAEATVLQSTRQVLLLHERHPNLKSDALYRDLHDRLWAIEEKIAHSRTFYGDTVTEWNVRIAQFPASLVARVLGATPAPLFAAECAEALPPRLA
ncbi:MAG: LemA family protein [Planctomycetes bacterium]|nr:LemA family protein [Planctomycetota bacterium]